MHMLRPGSPLLPDFSKGFGEIYFSEVLPGHVKAWKRHTRQTQHFAVPSGLLKIVMYDDRPDSETRGVLRELALACDRSYHLALPDDEDQAPKITVGEANFGLYPMVTGQSRLGRCQIGLEVDGTKRALATGLTDSGAERQIDLVQCR